MFYIYYSNNHKTQHNGTGQGQQDNRQGRENTAAQPEEDPARTKLEPGIIRPDYLQGIRRKEREKGSGTRDSFSRSARQTTEPHRCRWSRDKGEQGQGTAARTEPKARHTDQHDTRDHKASRSAPKISQPTPANA